MTTVAPEIEVLLREIGTALGGTPVLLRISHTAEGCLAVSSWWGGPVPGLPGLEQISEVELSDVVPLRLERLRRAMGCFVDGGVVMPRTLPLPAQATLLVRRHRILGLLLVISDEQVPVGPPQRSRAVGLRRELCRAMPNGAVEVPRLLRLSARAFRIVCLAAVGTPVTVIADALRQEPDAVRAELDRALARLDRPCPRLLLEEMAGLEGWTTEGPSEEDRLSPRRSRARAAHAP